MLLETIAKRLKTITISLSNLPKGKSPYWIEIITQQPSCTYYFGPFHNVVEARELQGGYIEDLVAERAMGISVEIKRCLPTKLTITAEECFAD